MEIKTGFTAYDGKYYPNVRTINFLNAEDLRNYRGSFINETKVEPNSFFGGSQSETTGVYIFKSLLDDKKAFRIYKDWSNNVFCNVEQHTMDVKMISNLSEKQKEIELTEFPTGLITLNGNTIGQEIPLYMNSITFAESIENLNKEEIIKIYLKILTILKELVQHNIIYSDVHAKNFMLVDDLVRLIDFDPFYITFNMTLYKYMITNLKAMLNVISNYKNIDLYFDKELTIDDIEETILTKTLK